MAAAVERALRERAYGVWSQALRSLFETREHDADAECGPRQSIRLWIWRTCASAGPRNGAVFKPNSRNMHLAGNLASCAKVNISKKSALLDPRVREHAPSAGFEERCNSDYTRRDAVSSLRRLKRLCKYKFNGARGSL